ncbi:helix-turn-helix domain-containing protein [Ekhidna sp.]|uniref:helix-turn-helix domain-containing protein n=1 Tax=Ekhidna sp. TaxID=2608089 RepID=UPI003299C4AB
MDSLTSILVIVLSIGLTQGVVFSFILWRKSDEGRIANRFKSILLLILSYGLLNQVLRLYGIGYYDLWYHITLDLSWSYGPLLFLYVKAQTTPGYRFTKSDRWILLPIFIQIICSVYVRSQNFFWDGTRESLTWLGYYGYAYWRNYSTVPIIASILIIYYSYRSLQILNKLNRDDVDKSNYRWVKNLVRIFGSYYILVLLILVIDLIIYLVTVSTDYYYFTRFYYYPFFIGIAILIYWFGISGIIRGDQRVVKVKKKLSASEKQALISIAETLEKQMQEAKIYKDPDLTLSSLADRLSIKSYLLTKTLNEIINKPFNDYMNEYRVKEIEELIKEPSNDKYTLLSLAFEAGFNSKSSFNRAVKKHLGMAPSDLKSKN